MKPRVVVVGGGTAGSLAALYLQRMGMPTVLLEGRRSLLQGANQVAAVLHGTGSEYPCDPDRRTGTDCIDGALLFRLLFPESMFTPLLGPDRAASFLLSERTAASGRLSLNQFVGHADAMTAHYAGVVERFAQSAGVGAAAAEDRLFGPAADFLRPLKPRDWSDCVGVAAGYDARSATFGLNAAAFASLVGGALDDAGVVVHYEKEAAAIEREGAGWIVRTTDGDAFEAEQVVLASSHLNSKIAATLGVSPPPARCHVHFNLATYVRFPPGVPVPFRFTLIGEDGGMLCPLEPSTADGTLAILYKPSRLGSQIETSLNDPAAGVYPPAEWDRPASTAELSARGEEVLRRLASIYPVLEHAKVERVLPRTVVTYDGAVREIRRADRSTTYAPGVVGVTATKFTNAATSAIETTAAVQNHWIAKGRIDERERLLPRGLDFGRLPQLFSLRDAPIDSARAEAFARETGLPPPRPVEPSIPERADA
ncbi:MAG: FAD-dependent oxidoreductase [Planctomycetia bacterium]